MIAGIHTIIIPFSFRSGGRFIGFFTLFRYTFLWQEQPILFRFFIISIDSACEVVIGIGNANIEVFKTKLPVGKKDSSNSNVGMYLYTNCFNIGSVICTPRKVSQIKLNLVPSIRHNYSSNEIWFFFSFVTKEM